MQTIIDMENYKISSGRIFRFMVYIFLAVGSFVLIRYFVTPKKADAVASEDLNIFVEQAIFESDQKLKQGPADDASSWVSWYKSSAALYHEAKRHHDKKVQAQSQVLKEKLTKVQKKSFPNQRKSYAQSKAEVLATKAIDIETSGKINDTLLLTGDIFESKRAQNEFMKGIDKIVKDLRFHKVVFHWNGDNNQHSDYDVSAKADAEI